MSARAVFRLVIALGTGALAGHFAAVETGRPATLLLASALCALALAVAVSCAKARGEGGRRPVLAVCEGAAVFAGAILGAAVGGG